MKTRLHSSLLLSAIAIFVSPASPAAASDTPAKAFRINAIEQRNQPVVERGTSEFTVRRIMGEPRRKLDATTWVYDRFEACDWKIETGDCSTLLITFANGKVEELKLVNDRAEKIITAGIKKGAAPVAVAASGEKPSSDAK